jgi:hypothetical protein
VELEQSAAAWRKRGYNIAAISYDSPAILRYFAEKRKLSYPLLSDPESKIIRAFGILNDTIPEKNPFYGIPNPGTYLVNPQGKVLSKYFEDDYTERFTSADLLVKEFGLKALEGIAAAPPHQTEQTKHLNLTSSSTATLVRPGQRIALSLDVQLAKGMHVYAPQVKGYRPIAWTLKTAPAVAKPHEIAYPKSKILYLKAIRGKVPVYEGAFRLVQEITLGNTRTLKPLLSPGGELTIEGEFEYQACDAKVCYIPQTIPLRWKLVVEGHDGERAPKELRRPGL